MKRIAIPTIKDELSEFFGQCETYEIYTVENDLISGKSIEIPPKKDLTLMPEWAASLGITDIIAYKVDKSIINLFTGYRINLFVGIPIRSPQQLIEDYINGRLRSDKRIINEIMETLV